MKILVTGGAGFIGANFIYELLESRKNSEIVCLDSLTYAGNIKTLESAIKDDRLTFVRGDITERETVFALFERYRFDVAVNFAAESHVDRSIENPEIFLKTNILGVQQLLDACRKYDVARFHQVSTDEVYGDLPVDRPDLLFTEKSPLRASSPYSASKASADLLVLAYYRTYGLSATISRCSNNYGQYQFPEKFIPLIISRAINDKSVPVYGTGENIRDWLHVKDHCKAIIAVIERGKAGAVYNVGGNNEKRNIDIALSILGVLGKSVSLIEYVPDRPGHDLRYAIDSGKIQSELGWKPEIEFEDGLRQTVDWYLHNNDWWENIVNGDYTQYYERMYGSR